MKCFPLLRTNHKMETERTHDYAYSKDIMELDFDGLYTLYTIPIESVYYKKRYDKEINKKQYVKEMKTLQHFLYNTMKMTQKQYMNMDIIKALWS